MPARMPARRTHATPTRTHTDNPTTATSTATATATVAVALSAIAIAIAPEPATATATTAAITKGIRHRYRHTPRTMPILHKATTYHFTTNLPVYLPTYLRALGDGVLDTRQWAPNFLHRSPYPFPPRSPNFQIPNSQFLILISTHAISMSNSPFFQSALSTAMRPYQGGYGPAKNKAFPDEATRASWYY
ncbi:hypothetical protein BU24DRAFT_147443 [Aaosphaeria arxii CBS 175.79]|uniref:Uncharacterized protein n=1 Tax=Aaosphaeria arxii CBS 175.79 TaxID=1450172 RepID=A0A6A5XX44_9PLEO|nr:uncharacterized protein BU24DRAFT_147443 [Aaosphaeria arxii CBS 175.79]KAF2017281.1 hypothetical protein BU24DRAFT_147443 [Aaosphaeria arxii CBS 175.79]